MIVTVILATIVVSLISLVGILLLSLKKETSNTIVFLVLSFASGSLLAAAFFDLIPESFEKIVPEDALVVCLLGLLSFFVLERVIHWHHEHHDHAEHEKPVGYLVLIGDGVHNFFDGAAIAASFLSSVEIGITTTVAIIAHEIPQELSDFTLLRYAGFSTKKALAYNLISALTAIAGAVGFFYLTSYIKDIEVYGLAFTAGAFIYIAGTDLLPELNKEKELKKSIVQLIAMLAGIVIIWIVVHFL